MLYIKLILSFYNYKESYGIKKKFFHKIYIKPDFLIKFWKKNKNFDDFLKKIRMVCLKSFVFYLNLYGIKILV